MSFSSILLLNNYYKTYTCDSTVYSDAYKSLPIYITYIYHPYTMDLSHLNSVIFVYPRLQLLWPTLVKMLAAIAPIIQDIQTSSCSSGSDDKISSHFPSEVTSGQNTPCSSPASNAPSTFPVAVVSDTDCSNKLNNESESHMDSWIYQVTG